MASTAKSSALAPSGWKISANICSISISSMNFSYDVVSPLSSQPAACSTKLQPPISAPHRLICDSYAACASGALEAVALEERHGRPMWRASCPAPNEDLTYSGVPNAGEPDFMSTLDVKLPYTTGAPGRTICDSTVPASASAWASVRAPATVTGAITGQGERRDDEYLSGRGELEDAVTHRDVELQRRVGVDDGGYVRTRTKFLRGEPVSDPDELEIVGDLRRAARVDLGNLVGEHQHRTRGFQMPELHRHVLRFDA